MHQNIRYEDILTDEMILTRGMSIDFIYWYENCIHCLYPWMFDMKQFWEDHKVFCAIIFGDAAELRLLFEQGHHEIDLLSFSALYFPIVVAAANARYELYGDHSLDQITAKYLQAFEKIQRIIVAPSPCMSEWLRGHRITRQSHIAELILTGSILMAVTSRKVVIEDVKDIVSSIKVLSYDCEYVRQFELSNNGKFQKLTSIRQSVVFNLYLRALQANRLFPIQAVRRRFISTKHDSQYLVNASFLARIQQKYDEIVHDVVIAYGLKFKQDPESLEPILENISYFRGYIEVEVKRFDRKSFSGSDSAIRFFRFSRAYMGSCADRLATWVVVFCKDCDIEFVQCALSGLSLIIENCDFLLYNPQVWFAKQLFPGYEFIMVYRAFMIVIPRSEFQFCEMVQYATAVQKSLMTIRRCWIVHEDDESFILMWFLMWEVILRRFGLLELIAEYMERLGEDVEDCLTYIPSPPTHDTYDMEALRQMEQSCPLWYADGAQGVTSNFDKCHLATSSIGEDRWETWGLDFAKLTGPFEGAPVPLRKWTSEMPDILNPVVTILRNKMEASKDYNETDDRVLQRTQLAFIIDDMERNLFK